MRRKPFPYWKCIFKMGKSTATIWQQIYEQNTPISERVRMACDSLVTDKSFASCEETCCNLTSCNKPLE